MPAMTGSTISRMTRACERGVDERTRRERAHAAGVRPAVVVEDPLVILRRCRSARARAPSQTTKNDTSGPVRHSSMTSRSPAAPNAARPSPRRSPRSAVGAVLGDDDALAGGEAVGLQHDRASRTRRDRDDAPAPRRATRRSRKRAVGTPWRAMKAFANALLDSRRAAARGRPEQQPAVGGEAIGDAEAQRQLGADDGEVDLLALGEREQRRRGRRGRRDACAPGGRCRDFPARRRRRRRRVRRPAGRRARARARRCR